jgi:predicted cupin superfamily sugar epimerase
LLEPGGSFALLGATMAPGFDYADYEEGMREVLIASYPGAHELIVRLTASSNTR